MSTMLVLLFNVALVGVTQCRVTFTHSEVLQETDLDKNMMAPFKCDNGCLIYSDSRNADMFVTDGTMDYTTLLLMGPPDRSIPVELLPGKDYKLEYRGVGTPPRFVFYAVDKKSSNLDTPVYAANNEAGFLSDSKYAKRFTVLNSFDPSFYITFQGAFATGYPRIYTTGYDAATEDACKPVYQARSQENALNSLITVPSPILTVENVASAVKTNAHQRNSEAVGEKAANSSVVYMSPGYVGCSYVGNQIYSSDTNTVLDNFSADVKSLDFTASINIPSANEAAQITVNGERTDLYGVPSMTKHYDADRFYVTISWIRNTATSSFAVQFDLGVENKGNEEGKSTTKGTGAVTSTTRDVNDMSTTSESSITMITLSSLLTVAYVALW